MKKTISAIMSMIIAFSLISCSTDGTSTRSEPTANYVDTLEPMVEDETEDTETLGHWGDTTDDRTNFDAGVEKAEGVDVDLTILSASMVYAEVYSMMTKPDDYIGKVVRMEGTLSTIVDNGVTYYACIIEDATACCAQGIEFVLTEDYTYPAEGETVIVEGTYELYQDSGYTFMNLAGASLITE